MPSIMHAHLRDLDTPERFAEGALILDTRYQRHATWAPAVVAPLFAGGHYLHVPALGSQACADGEGETTPQLIAWQEGLTQVQAVYDDMQKLVVLCHCPEQASRCHRQVVARELVAALSLTDGGALP